MNNNTKPRVVNLYAGPGTGKSTTMAALFAELKYQGYNVEMVPEYAKEATWERRGEKVFQAQDYIFGKQNFRLMRVAGEVEITVTDAPLLLCTVYGEKHAHLTMPSLRQTVYEAYTQYDNLDVFLRRNKPYNPKGRNQTEDEARALDEKILVALEAYSDDFRVLDFGRQNVTQIMELMHERGWV